MAILRNHGVLLVDSIPTHTPTEEQARLARLTNTLTFYYYNGSSWTTVRLNSAETYTGDIIPDNVDLGTALQSLETAILAVEQDGNHALISRGNDDENIPPTTGEVPSPRNGDTADVLLTDGILEKWLYNGSLWVLAFELDYNSTTNLGYSSTPISGTITSSTGTDANIPLAGVTAGLMTSIDKVKLDFITISKNVNLNEPPIYSSRLLATSSLGTGYRFQYSAANIDGAVEGTVCFT